jgi:hypothetical protein
LFLAADPARRPFYTMTQPDSHLRKGSPPRDARTRDKEYPTGITLRAGAPRGRGR